ncbi:MAG: ATP-binding cassette domain-containing protein [Nannocystaceae bacterium]
MLDRVVTRTLELEAGQLYSYEGGFATYLDAKAERLALARRTEANRQNFLRRELEWLRRQPKARGGKQRARINRIEAARANKPAREQGSLSFQLQSGRAAKTILDLRGLQVAVDGRVLVDGLTLGISRGERVGVLGPNGCGKSTLLRVLAGERPQDGGEVLRGRGLRVAHLDQARGELKGDWSVRRNAAAHAEVIKVGDQTLDVGRYLDRFLFDPADQARRVDTLSGSEQAQLALACLLVREVDLALLDEPTNDLDVDTLGAVEEMLLAHDGAAVIVTHDRWFLDRVATSILAFTGDGVVEHYQGDYTTYLALSAEREREREAPPPQAQQPATQAAPAERPRRLTYSEQRELAGLLDRVEQAEERVAALEAELADPESYRDSGERARELGRALAEAREEARTLCARWETLEAIREAAER